MPDIVLLVDLAMRFAQVVLGAVTLLAAGLLVFDRRENLIETARASDREQRRVA